MQGHHRAAGESPRGAPPAAQDGLPTPTEGSTTPESPDKAVSFAAAYEIEADRLCLELQVCFEEEGTCAERIEAVLRKLVNLVATRPAVSRALFLEVHLAGGTALSKREEVLKQLAEAVEDACPAPSTHTVPSLTGEFVVGVVEQAVARSVANESPEELRAVIPELAALLSRIYRPD